ncbi:pyroglutamyl-peptidase [Brevibacterium pityocampae]
MIVRSNLTWVGAGVNDRRLDYCGAMTILVTGFEPFGGDPENASEQVVVRLRDRSWDAEVELATAILPVTWDGAAPALLEAIAAHRPDAVVALGEAGGRAEVTPERRARNLGHDRIPDNAGVERPAAPLDEGPEWLDSRIDPETLVEAIRGAGVPAETSRDAGAFLCNAVFRTLLRDTDLPAAFIHLPAVRTRGAATVGSETDPGAAAAMPELTFDQLADAVAACIRVVVSASGRARSCRPLRPGCP